MLKLRIKVLVGFILEISAFFIAGMVFAYGYDLASFFYFCLALALAGWTGARIQEITIKAYELKKQNENK